AEEEAVPDLAREPEVLARVVVDDDGQVDAPLEVGLDGLDRRRLAREGDVEDVGPGARPEAHAVARAQSRRFGPAQLAVEAQQVVARERLGPLEERAAALVERAHGSL